MPKNNNWKNDGKYPQNNGYRNGNNRGQKREIYLPEGYLDGGYFEDVEKKDKLKAEYVVDYAKELAEDFHFEGRGRENKNSQIRRFYEELLWIERQMGRFHDDYSYVEAYLLDLVPKVVYAKSRCLVTNIFEQFITQNAEAVKDAKDLRAFALHFEAIIAFASVYKESR